MNELSRHHYDVWKAWDEKVRGNAINESDIIDMSPLHQETFFFVSEDGQVSEKIPPNDKDTFYVKATKNNVNYIIPTRFIDMLPFEPKNTLNVRLKKSDPKIYQFVRDVISYTIPLKLMAKNEDIKHFFEHEFNPIPHTNPDHNTLLKLIAFCNQLKLCVCGEVGCMKNANQTILKHMLGGYARIGECTKAMLWYTLKSKQYITCDEIPNWESSYIKSIESIAGAIADEDPEIPKYSLGKGLGLENLDVDSLSFIFTYNRPMDLNLKKKSVSPFEDKWSGPQRINNRYPRLLFSGGPSANIGKINKATAKNLMEKYFKEMCDVAAKAQYIKHNYHLHLHKYDRSKVKFTRRHLANINSLLDLIDVISLDQEEFDRYIDVLNKCSDDYDHMMKVYESGKKYIVKEEDDEEENKKSDVWDFSKNT